jgi:hypothetical protein
MSLTTSFYRSEEDRMSKNRLVGIIVACAIVAIAAIVPFAFKPWQGPASVAWSVTFGGSELDGGRSVQQSADGGYVITGHAMSYRTSKTDVWLIKTDSLGNMAWNKTFGGSRLDYGLSVQQTSDRGYIMAGYTYSYGAGRSDVWLIKTDSLGNMAWNETFGGSGEDMGYSVQQTSDGGYVVAGYTHSYGAGESDAWLIKTDSSGNVAWNQTFGDSEVDRGYSVQQTRTAATSSPVTQVPMGRAEVMSG